MSTAGPHKVRSQGKVARKPGKIAHPQENIARCDADTASLRRELLGWFALRRRDLPWRHTADPYAIWVSEIMLQQTRVAAVVEKYAAFMARLPTVAALAAAPEQEVLALWSGLGYYRRARMLHQAARQTMSELAGKLPATATELLKLPGIGAYTAAAIASIAHGEPVAVVDGNVERVLCRLAGWEHDGSAAVRGKINALARHILDPLHPGESNQAIMELGALVCTPRNPLCVACPLVAECRTKGEHKTVARAAMISREVGYALCLRSGRDQNVLLEQRGPEQTVMPGLWELPTLLAAAVPEADLRMTVRHAIMQVNYLVRVRTVAPGDVDALTPLAGKRRWVRLSEAGDMALTGLARKVLKRARLIE